MLQQCGLGVHPVRAFRGLGIAVTLLPIPRYMDWRYLRPGAAGTAAGRWWPAPGPPGMCGCVPAA